MSLRRSLGKLCSTKTHVPLGALGILLSGKELLAVGESLGRESVDSGETSADKLDGSVPAIHPGSVDRHCRTVDKPEFTRSC